MINNLNTTTTGDMIYGFMDNMSDEQIDQEIKLFRRYARMLGAKDYTNLIVLIDDDQQYDPYYINSEYNRYIVNVKSGDGWELIDAFEKFGHYDPTGLLMIREQREGTWNIFYFFKNEYDLNKYVEYYDYVRE